MPVREAEAVWNGDLKTGKGRVKLGSGAFEGPYSFQTRFESEQGTNPEELIGASLAGCYTMAMSSALTKAGKPPTKLQTKAKVTFDKVGEGFKITKIHLALEGSVPGFNEADFKSTAETVKKTCPISQALTGTEIEVDAKLLG